MSEQKVITINVQAAKSKVKDASSKALGVARERLKAASGTILEKAQERGETLRSKIQERREQALAKLVDKGIQLTKRQMTLLQSLKKR